MSRLPSSQRYKRHTKRWKRYEKPLPGHRVQVDVKFIAPLKGTRKRYYQFTVVDDCTRLRVLRICDRLNQKTAIQFIDYVLERLPFRVETIQTDNGSEFQAAFHWHVLDRGVQHVYIKPSTPRLNGKVERSHRIDEEEFYRMLDGVVIDSTALFNEKLREWENFYNYNCPHGGLGGHTPYERLRQRTRPEAVTGQRWLHTSAPACSSRLRGSLTPLTRFAPEFGNRKVLAQGEDASFSQLVLSELSIRRWNNCRAYLSKEVSWWQISWLIDQLKSGRSGPDFKPTEYRPALRPDSPNVDVVFIADNTVRVLKYSHLQDSLSRTGTEVNGDPFIL